MKMCNVALTNNYVVYARLYHWDVASLLDDFRMGFPFKIIVYLLFI